MTAVSAHRASTLLLKAVIVLIGAAALALVVFSFPNVWRGAAIEWPQITRVIYPALIGIYVTIIPFIIALYQAFKILRHIDRNDAFSEASVKALKRIKWCAVAISAGYAAALPLMFVIAQLDDAPGLVLISTAVAASPLIFATLAAVLQKLVRSAIDLKTENELTI